MNAKRSGYPSGYEIISDNLSFVNALRQAAGFDASPYRDPNGYNIISPTGGIRSLDDLNTDILAEDFEIHLLTNMNWKVGVKKI